MAGILPLLLALLMAHGAQIAGLPLKGHELLLPVVALTGLLWSALALAVGAVIGRLEYCQCLRCGRWWDGAGLGLLLALYAWWCFTLGWAQVSAWSVVLLLPMIIGLAVHWYAMGLAHGMGWGARNGWGLWLRLRLVVLPAFLLILGLDLIQALFSLPAWDSWWQSSLGAGLLFVLSLLAPLLALALLPPLMVRLWGARALAPGALRDDIQTWCNSAGVSVRAVLMWPARGVPFYNAAVLGLMPRFRYILISEDLLRDCPPEQVQAVLGHELGHARHGHIWLYLLFLLASGLWTQVLSEWVSPPLAAMLGLGGVGLVQVVLWIALWGLALRVGFGVVSRACERQADLFGAQVAGDPGPMAEALYSVARLSGSDPHEPNWRHYSIAERVAYLGRLRQAPHTQSWHTKYVMNIRALILILLAVGLALTFFSNPRYVELPALRESDSALDQALSRAEAGEVAGLERWLLQQSPAKRQSLAAALILRLGHESVTVDDRLLYDHRHWLIPFTEISTGNEDMDLFLDNALAYGLSAGTREHSESELALMQRLLEPLRKGAEGSESASIWDTVGCIYFVLGQRDEAINAFQRAQQLLADSEDDISQALRRMVNARIRAASDPEQPLPVIWGNEGDLTSDGFPVVNDPSAPSSQPSAAAVQAAEGVGEEMGEEGAGQETGRQTDQQADQADGAASGPDYLEPPL